MLYVGAIGLLTVGVQPLLLGALADAGRLTIQEVGRAGAVELLALGAAAPIAGFALPARRLRGIGFVAAVTVALADCASAYVSGAAILMFRGLAGIAEGLLLWIPSLLIARSDTPARWSGALVTLQTIGQLVFAAILPVTFMRWFGLYGGWYAAAGVTLTVALASFLIPDSLSSLPIRSSASRAVDGRVIEAMLAVFAYMAFIFGVWVYFERLAVFAGLPARVAALGISVSLAFQVLGGGTGTLLSDRLPHVPTFIWVAALNLGVLTVLGLSPVTFMYVAGLALFGFLAMFILPFQMHVVLEADPTRRSTMYVSGIQLLGAGAGPLLASLFVSASSVSGALYAGAACLVSSVAVILWIHYQAVRRLKQIPG
jgi:DHA1 family inner membrane transport protein